MKAKPKHEIVIFDEYLKKQYPGDTSPKDFKVKRGFNICYILVGLIIFCVLFVCTTWLIQYLDKSTKIDSTYVDFFKATTQSLMMLVSFVLGRILSKKE